MLVDDEILFRENIRDCIQWEQEGFEYCGDASDGEVALPLIEQWMPDILITDIKMPFMNGLELSSIIRKRMPDIKIIILSGHDEFEYAQAALRIGVDEYCIKPVSAADIIKQLHQMSQKIDSERLEKEQLHKLTQMVANQTMRTQDMLLTDLCSGFITTVEAVQAATSLSLHLIAKYYTVIITEFRSRESESSLSIDSSVISQYEAQFEQNLKNNVEFLSFKRIRTERVWILQGNTVEQLQHTIESIQEQHSLTDHLFTSIELTYGMGTIQDRLQGIHDSYLEAEEDKHWRRLTKLNRNALYTIAGDSLDHTISLDHSVFIEFLKFGSPANIQPFVEQFASDLKRLNWNTSFYGYYILNDLILKVFQSVKETFLNSADDTSEIFGRLQKQIEAIDGWEKAFIYLTNLAQQYWLRRKDATDKYTEMLNQVKEYIHRSYHNNQLSLLDAAEYVSVSPSHLSKIFSQEIGQTFIEYVTHVRIRKAMELLKSTHAKSYEIAFQVGYNDAHYFSNLFKKSTGMTTKEFRRKDTISIQSSGTDGS